jgi:hypothetical protein
MRTKPIEKRVVVPKDVEPKLTLQEGKELLAALWIESGHYKNVPSDYWTPDMHTLEYAKSRMWLRIFGQEHPPKTTEEGAELMTKFEWQMALRAAEFELQRLGVVRKECWTEGNHALLSAYKKILGPAFS